MSKTYSYTMLPRDPKSPRANFYSMRKALAHYTSQRKSYPDNIHRLHAQDCVTGLTTLLRHHNLHRQGINGTVLNN